MGHYTEISNSQYSAKDTALYNRMNGVSNHSMLGAILSSNTMNIFSLATSFAGNSNSGNDVVGSDVDAENYDAKETQTKVGNFSDAMFAFVQNKNKDTAKALKEAYEANPDNPTISRYYENYKEEVDKLLA